MRIISQLKKLSLLLFSLCSVSIAMATQEQVTSGATHNGQTYNVGPGDLGVKTINICDGESITFDLSDPSQSTTYHRVYKVGYNLDCISSGNSYYPTQYVLAPTSTTPSSVVFNLSGNTIEEYRIVVDNTTSSAGPYSTNSCEFNYSHYIVRVHPNTIITSAFTYTLDANGLPTDLQSSFTDPEVTHSWEYAYVSDPTNFNTIYLTNGANPAVSADLDIFEVWNYGTVFKNKCVIIRHTVSHPCVSATYEMELCFDACDVSAEFTVYENYITAGGIASLTLMTDEDANNPGLFGFTGEWIVKENGVVTTNYPVDANNNVMIPANVNFEFCYIVNGYTSAWPSGPSGSNVDACYDEFCVDVNVRYDGNVDCRRLQLGSATIFEQIAVPGNPSEAVVIYPIVTYLSGGSMVSASLTPSSIVFVSINGVAQPLSILNSIGNHATINGLNYGDKVCITIEFKGCHIEHCYEIVKVKEGPSCDISMIVNMPIDGNKYPCKRVFVATGSDAINGNMVWKVDGVVQNGSVGTSFTYTVGASSQICVGTQKCPDVCVVEGCRSGDRRMAQPSETIEVFFNSYNELIFEGNGTVSNIVLYNIQGQEVYRLLDFELQGEEVRQFDYNESGIFFLRFEVEGKVQSRKIVLN